MIPKTPSVHELALFRMDSAQDCLASASILYRQEAYKSAANRAYYAVFHCMRAVLAFDGFESKYHSGIIAEFRRRHVKDGTFPVEMSDTITLLSDTRNRCDYEDFYEVSEDMVELLIQRAEEFYQYVLQYVTSYHPQA